MAKIEEILPFAVFVAVLFLIPKIQSQYADNYSPPLCRTQFALVNHACAYLPRHHDDDDDDDPSPPSLPDDGRDDAGGSGGDDGQGRVDDDADMYGQSLVDDDTSSGDERRNRSRRHRHRRRRHRQRDGGGDGDAEEECCRWLKDMDEMCVCSLLLRLPPFLTKLEHEYTVEVGHACNVTFACDGMYGG